MDKNWKLSPSDLTFLWDECQLCFYLKYVHNFPRPSTPFPKIFSRIDKLMKDFFREKQIDELSPDLPAGNVLYSEKWVKSAPIEFPEHNSSCYIRGKFDTALQFNNGTFGVVDFKTSESKPEHTTFYSRQLHAYAYALEHPAENSLRLNPVTVMGLLCVEPVMMNSLPSRQYAYIGNATWLECPKNENNFLNFLESILNLLEQPAPPPANPECGWCKYREQANLKLY